MNLRIASWLLAGALTALVVPKAAAQKPTSGTDDPRLVSLEVAARQTLRHLALDARQLRSLAVLCQGTASAPRTQGAGKAGPRFRKTLTELRAALVAGDEERTEELSDRLDKLFDQESVELSDRVPI